MKVVPETHQTGSLLIENVPEVLAMDGTNCDVGLQTSADGRIWLCVNGVAFVRFSPLRTPKQKPQTKNK